MQVILSKIGRVHWLSKYFKNWIRNKIIKSETPFYFDELIESSGFPFYYLQIHTRNVGKERSSKFLLLYTSNKSFLKP